MPLRFEWDAEKARANLKKHGVSFEEAATVFGDRLSFTISDREHSQDEDRFVTMGASVSGRILVVIHVDRPDAIRIISARVAKPSERRDHEEGEEQ